MGEVDLDRSTSRGLSRGLSICSKQPKADLPSSGAPTVFPGALDHRPVVRLGSGPPPQGRERRFRRAPQEAGRIRLSQGPEPIRDRGSAREAPWRRGSRGSELHQAYVGQWRDLHHSGRVPQALSLAPTGAICAAATTSLPEAVGGTRKWDYRYTWGRDASFTIEAMGWRPVLTKRTSSSSS